MAAQQLCLLDNLFPPENCLSFPHLSWYGPYLDMAAITLTPTDTSCGTSSNCSWSIGDIFSGPLLVSIHKITAIPTGVYVINTVCYGSPNLVTETLEVETITSELRCRASHPAKWKKNPPLQLHYCKLTLKILVTVTLKFIRHLACTQWCIAG